MWPQPIPLVTPYLYSVPLHWIPQPPARYTLVFAHVPFFKESCFFMWWVSLLFKITSSVKPSLLSPNPPSFLDPRHHDFPSGLAQTAFWYNLSIPEPAFLSRLWAPGLTQACDPASECLGELKTWPVSSWNLMLPNQTWVHSPHLSQAGLLTSGGGETKCNIYWKASKEYGGS